MIFLKKQIIITAISVGCALLLAFLTAFVIVENKREGDNPVLSVSSEIESNSDSSLEAESQEVMLNITSPASNKVNTTDAAFTFSGSCDPSQPLKMNGSEVTVSPSGAFSVNVNLEIGDNTFTFEHKGETKTYTVNYRYVIINGYNPSTKQTYSSGSTFYVLVSARKGSTVTAEFNGKIITLAEQPSEEDNINSEFTSYSGSFSLPNDSLKDIELGKVKYTAVYSGKSESFYSGTITCKKAAILVDYDPNATPLGGRYINVGSGKITEIVAYEAETFDAYSTNDWSKPTNNYLPQGTLDYSAQSYIYYNSKTEQREYAVLRCGYQVYTSRVDKPNSNTIQVVKEYVGTLPDHNEIGFYSLENTTQHTVLTLDTNWKAPFYLDLAPQAYNNPSIRDYTFTDATYSYVDITFCYATVFENEVVVPLDNPLFSHAQVIKNSADCTLRLYLKRQGQFYGWNAYYNQNGQLCFEFLNPAKITLKDNSYGADLTGVKILIDVGHGGIDVGAVGYNKVNTEAERNLNLANKVKAELEAIGATVYMTRDSNILSTNDTKLRIIKNLKPDYCIAIHHDSNTSSRLSGFGAYHFNAFSKKATDYIYQYNANSGIYSKSVLKWHNYYMLRSYVCPVVLTENGYMSNLNDFNAIINEAVNSQKAVAITQGIVEYFKSIQ